MNLNTSMLAILLVLLVIMMSTPLLFVFYIWRRDRHQREHAVLRNFPILGKMRYVFEMIGP